MLPCHLSEKTNRMRGAVSLRAAAFAVHEAARLGRDIARGRSPRGSATRPLRARPSRCKGHRSAAGTRADEASGACTRAYDPRAIERSSRPQQFERTAPAASVNPSASLRGAPLRSAPSGDGRVTGGRRA